VLIGLHLRDFALAERVDLALDGGFSVITGETGAGKSVLIQALAFALGSTADVEMIRPGADVAEVEAVFDLTDRDAYGPVARKLSDADVPFEGELILRRTVSRPLGGSQRLGGRVRINDRAATTSLLRDLAPTLADIHGQREHLSLLRPADQLTRLDRFAGVDHQRDAIGAMVRRLNALDHRLNDATTGERERARRVALLRHEASEIDAAGLQPDEEERLHSLHRRLVNAQTLAADAEAARTALQGDTLGEALAAARRIAELDPSAEPVAEAIESALEQLSEAVRSLRVYAEQIELDPNRLGEVESRLSLIREMKRRWGDTVAEVIAYGERAEAEADRLEQETADIDSLAAEAEQLADRVAAAATELSRRRKRAAKALAKAVIHECERLRLANARIEFEFGQIPASEQRRSLGISGIEVGFDQTGIDRVQLLVAFNPDSPTRPLQRVASGGETARLTLAIKAVLGESDLVPLMVFDEVDAGLGGRSGGMIGERLARMGEHRQVICITHLPQVAARAAQHISVSKSDNSSRTTVEVCMLSEDERVVELAEMLGGVSEANRASATDLLHPVVAS